MKMIKVKLGELRSLIESGAKPHIQTKTGLVEITDEYRKFSNGFLLKFSDGTELKCARNHEMFDGEKFIDAESISVGHEFSGKRVTSIDALPYQEWIDFSVAADHESYIHKGMIHHNSGKSSIIYIKMRYHLDMLGHNVLIVVPTTQLVEQLIDDFRDYSVLNGWDADANCQPLYSGKDKIFSKRVMVSTWQSLNAMMRLKNAAIKDIVDRTDAIILDEAHVYKSTEVLATMNQFVNTKWRTGTTGTIDEKAQLDKMQLIGLMGPTYNVISTKALMDQGSVTKLVIDIHLLDWPAYIKKEMYGVDGNTELKYLASSDMRNKYISDLSMSLSGNTLILVRFIDIQLKPLYEMIKAIAGDRRVEMIYGGIDTEDRERIRKVLDTESDAIVVTTYATMSTGTNIPSIENVIFGSPTKAMIKVRQSIGRGLRLRQGKTQCTLYDISDNLSHKKKMNPSMLGLYERIKTYESEKFEYKVRTVPIGSGSGEIQED